MNVQTIGTALRRKLGPFPVWVWAIAGGGVLYLLRAQGYFGSRVETGETLQPSQADAREPQAQVPLQPGESVYDPNTGGLTTAPGGEVGDADLPDDENTKLLTAILAAVTKKKPKPRAAKHKKPKHKKPKAKPAHKQKPVHHTGTSGHKKNPAKPRSKVTVRWKPERMKKPKKSVLTPLKPRTLKTASAKTTRQRPTTPMVTRSSHTQHPVSTHSKRNVRAKASPPRPSAPPARNVHRKVKKKAHR